MKVFNLLFISMTMVMLLSADSFFEFSPNENSSQTAFIVEENDLIPEGITCDSQTGRFFMGSKNKDKVIAIDPNGIHYDFIKTRQDGILSCLGLKVDVKRRRLWVVSNRVFEKKKVSVVHVFDVDNAKLIKKLYTPSDLKCHLNDLVLTDAGGAYITDTQSSRIFSVSSDLSRLEVFLADPLLKFPNGITISPDNFLLYIESDENGILIYDLTEKKLSPIKNPMSLNTGGIDGLMLYKNSLIGIVNSQYEDFEYVVRYRLSNKGRTILGASVIDLANPLFVTPTTGVVQKNILYVLAATCLDIYNRKLMHRKEFLKNPLILKYPLD